MNSYKQIIPIEVTQVLKKESLTYLNSYVIQYLDKKRNLREWELVSRGSLERVKSEVFNHVYPTDGTMIFATNECRDSVVLLKEFRVSANDYVYMLPAGLSENEESPFVTATREFHEETGMTFKPVYADPPQFVSIGIIDEKINVCYGYFSGVASTEFQDDNEHAEILILNRDEVVEIIDSPNFCVRSAQLLRSFFQIHPFLF